MIDFSPVRHFTDQLLREATPGAWLVQIGVLAAAFLVAWFIALRVCSRVNLQGRWKFGEGEFQRVAFPLFALVLVWAGKQVVQRFQEATALLEIVNALLVAWVLIRLAVYVLGTALPHGAFLRAIVRTIATIAWVGVALHITGLLPDVIDALDDIGFAVGKEKQRITLLIILQGLAAMAVTITIALWLSRVTQTRLLAADTLEMSTRIVISKVVHVVALFAAVMVALPMVGIDITVLSVFSGAVGVGVGFGLQKIAANYVSGFIVLLDRSLRIGDLVTIGAHEGTVKAIESRYTLIRSLDGKEFIIPNEKMITEIVAHHTYTDPKIALPVRVSVAYDSDLEKVERLLLEVAKSQPEVLPEPPPVVRFKHLGESGIDLDLILWMEAGKGDAPLRSALLKDILRAFRDEGVEIPYPRRDLRVIATPETRDSGARSTS